ncbi:MAG: hypothetical protein NC203_10135 [Firmicutes bacterium]|nr:hypothetical protein [[Eubacterium] siraeum]MCM1488711.1 hypothetical protein [Bacillota bacterium]
MKKLISVMLSLMLCFSLSAPASAAAVQGGTAQPYYEKAREATSVLSISGTKATCESMLRGKSDVTKIVANQYLQKEGILWIWSTYDGAEWTKTVNSSSLSMTNTKSGLTDGKYRLKTVFILTDSQGETETITVYSDEKTVG